MIRALRLILRDDALLLTPEMTVEAWFKRLDAACARRRVIREGRAEAAKRARA